MDAQKVLDILDACFSDAMRSGIGKTGLSLPLDLNSMTDLRLREVCERLLAIVDMINESYRYSDRLAQGDLREKPSKSNVFAMPLKGLQANLVHLTWQATQVANGDLSQHVQFLGDFSESFNHMIGSLRDKKLLEQQFQLIMDVIGEGVFLVDCTGKIIFANQEACKLLEYGCDELVNSMFSQLIEKSGPEHTEAVSTAIRLGANYDSELDFYCKSGSSIPAMIASRPVFKDNKLFGSVVAFRDFTEKIKYLQSLETLNKVLEIQATTDVLTGLYNRMKFNKSLTDELDRANRYATPLSLIIFDIDFFKKVNDTYGHQAGDDALKRLAQLVKARVRSSDVVARWGGEEFIILAPGVSLDGAAKMAEKLRFATENFDFTSPKNLTCSFGVAELRKNEIASSLINRADQALYFAKKNGRNQVLWECETELR